MSEPKLISPLLDGFAMGSPISEHDGVCCCPAIKENSDNKYIVKIISVPASQMQMDALLLTGAYKDPADAMEYYKEMAEGITEEAEFLKTLSRLEGFLPYECYQIEPITRHRLGYQVYLVGSYKRSLEKHMRRNPMTHLEAVNLGLDLCSALSVCRQAGRLYVDLKPANIFISENKGYMIGDLGFVKLEDLKFTSLPIKYHSPYSPPELHDHMATINDTADTYALGMILYQIYNDGQLPFRGKTPDAELPSPANADYEIAEIIMKAIHPYPAQRWSDPGTMGQALVAYMQRNSINDDPITPTAPIISDPADIVKVPKEESNDLSATVAFSAIQIPVKETVPQEETAEEPSEAGNTEETATEPADTAEETIAPPVVEESPSPEAMEPETEKASPETPVYDELSKMLAQADALISHQVPQDAVAAKAEAQDPFRFAQDEEEISDTDLPEEDSEIIEDTPRKKRERRRPTAEIKRKIKKVVTTIIVLILLALIGCASFLFYQNFYLLPIDSMIVDGNQNKLTVTVSTTADLRSIRVICSDNYGNAETRELTNGQAVFTDLLPNSMYNIQLEAEGFHKLTGKTSDIFTTDSITSIVSFSAITGPEDGSVLLTFTVDGGEPDEWLVTCTADGQEPVQQTFTGHSVTVKGLNVGSNYTFTLSGTEAMEMHGVNSLEFLVSRVLLAENLSVSSSTGTDMTISWETPGDAVVDSWEVRCYNDAGYDETLTVKDTSLYISPIDLTKSYTIEVTAAGMTQPARASITANPLIVKDFTVKEDDARQLSIDWDFQGDAPEGGWLLMYSIDGSELPNVVKCEDTEAVVNPSVPAATYRFTIQAADGKSVFSNIYVHNTPNAQIWNSQGLSADKITANLLVTPEEEDWTFDRVGTDDYTDTFQVGDKISIVLHGTTGFYIDPEEIEILYVIRDEFGNILPEYISQETDDWKDLWFDGDYHYGELDLPKAPEKPGNYSLSLYFNGLAITATDFTVTE